MNWDVIKGSWTELKGRVKQQWGDLTDDELTEIDGTKDRFIGALQKRYGYERDHAENLVDEFAKKLELSFKRM